MRNEGIVLALLAAGWIGLVTVYSSRTQVRDCAEPSARSVESLFAPCLERECRMPHELARGALSFPVHAGHASRCFPWRSGNRRLTRDGHQDGDKEEPDEALGLAGRVHARGVARDLA